jgi:hypothetical protein
MRLINIYFTGWKFQKSMTIWIFILLNIRDKYVFSNKKHYEKKHYEYKLGQVRIFWRNKFIYWLKYLSKASDAKTDKSTKQLV